MVTFFKFYNEIDGHIGVDGKKIRAAAADPKKNADVIDALAGELEGDEKKVADAVEGAIKVGTRKNPEAAKKVAQKLAQSGYYAVGLLNMFAGQVETFDATVKRLNNQLETDVGQKPFMDVYIDGLTGSKDVWEQSWADAKLALKPEYDAALLKVDNEADEIAIMFNEGPTPENVKELFREGLIPLEKQSLWPDIPLTDDDKRTAFENAVKNGTLPDFSTMSDEDVRSFISEHPEISDNLIVLMGAPYLSPALTKLVTVQAQLDAETLNTAVTGDPGPTTLAEISEATARLDAINASIAGGNKMTAAQGAYIESWMNRVGADNLAKLPEVVAASVPAGMPSYATESVVNGYLSPVSDAILNYSNPAVHRDDAGIDRSGYYGGSTFTPADGHITLSEMPQAIQDLTAMRLGESHNGYRYGSGEGFDSIKNLEAVNGWANLLSSASPGVEGGDTFSHALGEQAIHVKQDLNAILASANGLNQEDLKDWNPDARQLPPELRDLPGIKEMLDDSAASKLLSVAARNEDGASSLLINEDDRKALLGLNWDDDSGVVDVINSGTDRDPADGGGGPKQAEAALALIKEVGENQAGYLGGRYDSDGDGDIDKNDAVALGRMTEGISDAVVDAGINWVDQFGDAHDSSQENTAGDNSFEMNPSVESNFLRFVSGTGDEDAVRFHGAATWDAQQQITEAMRNGDDGDVKAAIDRAGRLEGRIVGADMEHQVDLAAAKDAGDNQSADEEYSAKQRQMAAFRLVADIGVSVIPGASAAEGASALTKAGVSMFNATSDKVQGGFLDQLFDAGSPPEDTHAQETKITSEWSAQAANDSQTIQRRIIVQAALESGMLSPDGIDSDLYSQTNGHYVLNPGADAEALKNPYFDLGLDEGTYESGWQTGFSGRDHDRLAGSGGWLDEGSAKSSLYGSLADDWDEDKEERYTSNYRGVESDADPYNVDPSKNDDYVEPYHKYVKP